MKSSAIPSVGEGGFSFFVSYMGGVFSFFGGVLASLWGGVPPLKALKVSENLDRSFKKESMASESFNCDIRGLTLSEKSGFCDR